MTQRRYAISSVVLLVSLFSSAMVGAQNIGTIYSGPVEGDGAAPYYNPAAMALGDSTIQLDVGAAFASLTYDPEGDRGAVSASPLRPYLTLGAFTDALHRDLRLGISIGLPNAAGADWDPESPAADITRYYLNKGTNLHFAATPALSYSPTPWLSFGAGAQLVYGTTTSNLDKDFGAQLNMTAMSDTIDSPFPYADRRFAAPINLDGSGFGIGGIFGVLLTPSPMFSFGASVHTPVNVNTNGNLSVTYPDSLVAAVDDILPSATLPDLNASFASTMDLPWTVHVGAVVRPIPKLELSLYYRWENLSTQPFWTVEIVEATSDAIGDTVKAQGYTDRHFVQLRAGYAVRPDLELGVFGSFQSNTVPEGTASPNTMDFNRIDVGLVARWRVSERIGLLAQYSHLFLQTRTIRESLHRPVTQPSLANFNHPEPDGTYSGSSNAIRLSLMVYFDRAPSPEPIPEPMPEETTDDAPEEQAEAARDSTGPADEAADEPETDEPETDEPETEAGEGWWSSPAPAE